MHQRSRIPCKLNDLRGRFFEVVERMQGQSALGDLKIPSASTPASHTQLRQRASEDYGDNTIFWPSLSFVPRNRTTTGSLIPRSLYASRMPSAIISHSVRPPKILTNIAVTRGYLRMTRKEDLTVSRVALPPVSRKLAQWPPRCVRASMVFMARPAPFTRSV